MIETETQTPIPGIPPLVDAMQFYRTLNISKSAFYQAIKDGIVPQPMKLATKCLWTVEQVREAIANIAAGDRGVGTNWTPRKAGRPRGSRNKPVEQAAA